MKLSFHEIAETTCMFEIENCPQFCLFVCRSVALGRHCVAEQAGVLISCRQLL